MKIAQIAFETPHFQPMQQHAHFASAMSALRLPMTTYALPAHGTAQVFTRRIRPFRRNFQMLSRGPYWPEPPSKALQFEAVSQLRDQNVRLINAESITPELLTAAGYRQIMTPTSVAVMDLQHGPDVRRALMSIKWRNALRKAESAELRMHVRPYRHVSDKWVLDADAKQQAKRGYRALPGEVTQAFSIMNKDQVIIVTASLVSVPIAAMIFLRHGDAATYHIGWTSTKGRAHNAHNMCLVTAMDALENLGTQVLDLGSVDTVSAPGLARFKLGAGAQVKSLGGTWLHLPGFRRQSAF
ncbi:MAG: GNAT family N-acetyltransferase [Yoonia sp.]|nr:GNAT family N-acetyltransferase [Yoonia sp.]